MIEYLMMQKCFLIKQKYIFFKMKAYIEINEVIRNIFKVLIIFNYEASWSTNKCLLYWLNDQRLIFWKYNLLYINSNAIFWYLLHLVYNRRSLTSFSRYIRTTLVRLSLIYSALEKWSVFEILIKMMNYEKFGFR